MTTGGCVALDGPDLGNRDLEVREHSRAGRPRTPRPLRSISSTSSTGAFTRAGSMAWSSGRCSRKSWTEELPLGRRLVARLEQADVHHLSGVVPLVNGVVDVEALVALQADQVGRRGCRRGLLATSVLPVPASPSRKSGRPSFRDRNRAVARPRPAKYRLLAERRLERVDRVRDPSRRLPGAPPKGPG